MWPRRAAEAPVSDVAEIRAKLRNPTAVCSALGLAKGSKRQTRGVTVLCPLHKERTPSCSITTGDDGTIRFNCFGCSATGDVLTLIAAVRGLDLKTQFREVLDQAAALAGVEVSDGKPSEPERISPASYNAIARSIVAACPFVDDPAVLKYCDDRILIAEGARAQLAALPPLETQGVLIAKLVDMFGADALERAGLLWRDKRTNEIQLDRFAHPENRLVIPWLNLDGSVAVLQRRRLDDGKPKYVFPAGIRPALPFGAERLRANDAERLIVFVEGALDVLALRLLDRRDGLGIMPLGLPGLDGWRKDWARFAKGRHVRIGFDADKAGERQVDGIADDLFGAGAAVVERWTPRAKDWAELVVQQVCAPKERAQ
jgi:DNA primase